MKVDIKKISGKSSGKKILLSDKIFSIEPNDHAIYLDVKSYLANQRQGNSKVKGRSEITGDFDLTTHGHTAHDHYTIVLELRKSY